MEFHSRHRFSCLRCGVKRQAQHSGLPASLMFLLVLSGGTIPAYAQKSVKEYLPSHRVALRVFIDTHPGFYFVPETRYVELHEAKRSWGRNFKPYYAVGDFNQDGIPDFAVLLLKVKALHIVIFNGVRGGRYRVAHTSLMDDDENAVSTTILKVARERAGQSLAIVFEDVEGFGCFIPAGKGYILEPCSE